MTKLEKVTMINNAISRSSVALRKGALAEILPDGRIQYSTRYERTGNKRKESFQGILSLLHGKDMRAILGKVRSA